MKNSRLPTVLALVLLSLGLAVGLLLVKNVPVWLTKASPTSIPQQVKITNISNTSLTISWLTDAPVQASLQYGPSSNLSWTASEDSAKNLHYLTLNNLSPQTAYAFKITGDTQTYSASTAPALTTPNPANNLAYGLINSQNGQPLSGVIVYLSYPDLSPQSTLTTSSGNWVVPLHLARSADFKSWFKETPATGQVFVQAGPLGSTTATVSTQNDTPVPAITLGQNETFVQPAPTRANPENQTQVSHFSLDSSTIIINNPQANEKITTSRPEFWGTAPPNTKITLEVHSKSSLTQEITTTPTGSWSWTPPSNLIPGEHTLGVSLADGTRATLNFTVLAAGDEELPAFTATPSGQTATATPTPTPPTRTSKPATTAGIPTSGNLTPTFVLSMMGIGLIILGVIIYYGRSFTPNSCR